jgi:peroxiredoxin
MLTSTWTSKRSFVPWLLRRVGPLVLTGLLACAGASTRAAEPPAPGTTAPDFTLPRVDGGAPVALKDVLTRNRATVLMFIAVKCPYSNGYNARMAQLGKDYMSKGVAVIGINSNKTEPTDKVLAHAREHGFTFPVVKDDRNTIADAYGATRTPEVFVLDPMGKVLYHGRIDEKYDDPAAVKSPDLRNALEAILAGRAVPAARTKAFGCSIKRI